METKPYHLSELNRIASYFTGHIDIANLPGSKAMERVERIADTVPYALLLHCFPQRGPVYVDIRFFALAGLPRPLRTEACKLFIDMLHLSDSWKGAGHYMHHFNNFPHDDLIASASFANHLTGQVVELEICSRALSFMGKNPGVILTLLGSSALFQQQGLINHSPITFELSKAMTLSPCEYDVYKYLSDPLTNDELALLLRRGTETVRSQKRAIAQKFAA